MKNNKTAKLLDAKIWYLILFLASVVKNIYPTKIANDLAMGSLDTIGDIAAAINPTFLMIFSLIFSALLSVVIFEVIINGIYNMLYVRNRTVNHFSSIGVPMRMTSKLPYSENFKQSLRIAFLVSNVVIGGFSLLGFLSEDIIAYGLNIVTSVVIIVSYLLAYKSLKSMLKLGTRTLTFKYLYLALCAYFLVMTVLSFNIAYTALIVIGIINILAIAAIAIICEKVILPRINKEEKLDISRIIKEEKKPDIKPDPKEIFKGFGF